MNNYFEKELPNLPTQNPAKAEQRQRIRKSSIEMVDVCPETLESEVPILFAPGWSNSPRTMKDTVQELANTSRRVLSIGHSKEDEIISSNTEFSNVELQKALSLVGVLISKKIEQVDAIGFSEGGINIGGES